MTVRGEAGVIPRDAPEATAVRSWLVIAAVAAIYFVAGKVGLTFASINSSASAVWPPTGIAIAALLLFGYRVWPAILLGAFLVNATTAGSALTSLGVGVGNTIEGLLAAYLVNRFAGGKAAFENALGFFRFVVLGALASTAVSATIGVSSLALGGFADWRNFDAIWLTWWLGDAAGALVVAPLLVLWSRPPNWARHRHRWLEATFLFFAVVGSGLLVFATPGIRDYPLAFLCLPAVVAVAFRFGPREVALCVATLSLIATWATESLLGPFVMASRNESLLVLQSFMATIALVLMPTAAVVRERWRAQAVDQQARHFAEDANQAKDQFLAMLSHELRNPLAAIGAALGILKEAPRDDATATQALQVVNRQSYHLARLVDDLLDLSRVTSGKIVLERETLELSIVVSRAVDSTRPLMNSRGHRFEVTWAAEPIWIVGDPTRLAQIVHNLLANAAKYTPNGGLVQVTVQKEEQNAVVRVRDSGAGIGPELLPSVFDLFTQGDRTLSRSEGGLGIGLSLTKRLVEMHGGTIAAFSDGAWRGSEFVVTLPLSAFQPSPRTAHRAAAGAAAGADAAELAAVRSVLVVDDNVDAAESIATLLRRRGINVRVAHDGPAAVSLAVEHRPDVALLDIGMPGLNGYEVAERLRKLDRGSEMLLVAVTGYGHEEDRRRARAAGFDEHLVKPVPLDTVEQILRDFAMSRLGSGA